MEKLTVQAVLWLAVASSTPSVGLGLPSTGNLRPTGKSFSTGKIQDYYKQRDEASFDTRQYLYGFEQMKDPERSFFSSGHCITLGITLALSATGMMESDNLGIFTNATSVGHTPTGCKVRYDPATGAYRITGGGNNIWARVDDFYYVWKKASGDMTLTADVQFVGTSAANHRKGVLMIRQSLDPGSAYSDAASHGNGLTSLQFRGAADELSFQIPTQVDGPARVRIVREKSRFTMYAGPVNGELKPVGPVEYVSLKDPVYVGLGVCSHVATTLETVIFTNVKLEQGTGTQ